MDPYRKALLGLSKDLKNDDMEAIVFLIGDQFGEGQTEKINKPLEFFNLLISHAHISAENNAFLIEMLEEIKRNDLVLKHFDRSSRTFKSLCPFSGESHIIQLHQEYPNQSMINAGVPPFPQQPFYPEETLGLPPTYVGSSDEPLTSKESSGDDASSVASSVASSSVASSSVAPEHRLTELKEVDWDGAASAVVESDMNRGQYVVRTHMCVCE